MTNTKLELGPILKITLFKPSIAKFKHFGHHCWAFKWSVSCYGRCLHCLLAGLRMQKKAKEVASAQGFYLGK